MSNRSRKRLGSEKLRRNLLIRVRRGALKAGTPLPGHSRVYSQDNLATAYAARGETLRGDLARLTDPHFATPTTTTSVKSTG